MNNNATNNTQRRGAPYMNHHTPPPRIAGRYQLGRKIGSGSFGEIHYGVDTNGQEIAVKMESLKKKTGHLLYESRLYKLLQGGLGIPNVYYYGCEDEYAVMVMDLLGPSLEELFVYCGRRFRLKTVCMLADQMLQRMEFVHTLGVIHRDIKPHNFLIGRQNRSHIVHIIDFGLAKRFKDPNTGQHIVYVENRNLTGTARYVSINTHLGCEQSRRDDIESLAYVIIYFIRTTLPWQGLKAQSKKDKYERIMDIKISTPLSELCEDYPVEFQLMLTYCRQLGFVDRPDYSFLRRLMKELLFREGFLYDFNFDWVSHADYNTVVPQLTDSYPPTNRAAVTVTDEAHDGGGNNTNCATKTTSLVVGSDVNHSGDKNGENTTQPIIDTKIKGNEDRSGRIDHQQHSANNENKCTDPVIDHGNNDYDAANEDRNKPQQTQVSHHQADQQQHQPHHISDTTQQGKTETPQPQEHHHNGGLEDSKAINDDEIPITVTNEIDGNTEEVVDIDCINTSGGITDKSIDDNISTTNDVSGSGGGPVIRPNVIPTELR